MASDHRVELRKQLQFLRNSSALYDQGFVEEAVRIAMTIRVLMHDTGNSTSLLALMGAKGIRLLTSAPELGSDVVAFMSPLTFIRAQMDNPVGGPPTIDVVCLPAGEAPLSAGRALTVSDWWGEVVYAFMDGQSASRRTLVLAAANQDGGAHVKKLPYLYAKLIDGTGAAGIVSTNERGEAEFKVVLTMMGEPDPWGEPIKNFPYSDLRQMATELLTSPELLALTE